MYPPAWVLKGALNLFVPRASFSLNSPMAGKSDLAPELLFAFIWSNVFSLGVLGLQVINSSFVIHPNTYMNIMIIGQI